MKEREFFLNDTHQHFLLPEIFSLQHLDISLLIPIKIPYIEKVSMLSYSRFYLAFNEKWSFGLFKHYSLLGLFASDYVESKQTLIT